MNKTLLTTFAVLFSLVIVLSLASADLEILNNPSSLTVYQGSSSSSSFIIINTGTDPINNIIISATNLPTGVTPSFTPNSISSLAPGANVTISFTLTATSEADLGEETSTINILYNISFTKSFNLNVNVKQRFCELGSKGNHVNLNLDNPDSGDDFYPGEEISVEFSVETNDDIDFTVEAELYDLTTQEVIADDSLDDNLDDDKQDYTLTIKVPADIDEGDDYIVRIKAYEDGEEDTQCDEKSVSVDIKRRSHELVIDKLIYSGLACGQSYNIGVKIENTGKKDENDVTVKIYSASLNISDEQTKDIDKGKSSTYTFTGTMPIVSPGTYSLRVDVTSDSGDADTSDLYTLNLQTNCRTLKTDASISTVPSQSYFDQENTIILTLTNTGDVSTTYTLDASSIAWASIISIQPNSINLGSGESGKVYITFMPNTNAATINFLPLTIKADGFSKSQTLQIQLQQKSTQGGTSNSFTETIKNNSWLFIFNVILLIIIIVLIILVATRASRRPHRAEEPKEARLKSNKKGRK